MKKENKVPSYKLLHESMPEIKFDMKTGDMLNMHLVGYIPNAKKPKSFTEALEQEEQLWVANKYTALAVNNLHLLAEALQTLLKEARHNSFYINGDLEDTPAERQAAEALKRIS